MERQSWKNTVGYIALLMLAYVVAVAGALAFGPQLDRYAYDFMFRLYQPAPWQPQSAILAIDARSLQQMGGPQSLRQSLADALRLVSAAAPKAVAIDIILADRHQGSKADIDLAAALQATPNLVLSSELLADGWEDPLPEFAARAALGHVSAQPDQDGILRSIPLEKVAGYTRRWALSLEAFRLSRGVKRIVESPDDLRVGGAIIPVARTVTRGNRRDGNRPMHIRFVPYNMPEIPQVTVKDLLARPALAKTFTGKVAFVGVTDVTQVHDGLQTPLNPEYLTPGIVIHANAFETMAQGLFITDVGPAWVLLFSLLLLAATGLSFRYLPGWWAYAGAILVLTVAHLTPYFFFEHRRVFSLATPASVAWFGTFAAAAYYHLVVRRNWRIEQAARTRYQQAMQFVTHEMRTPLSAIQGSSELISRYALTEDKRKQIALLINSESKRLARMVEVFLSVERLSAGQMELKREPISISQMIDVCVERSKPLADRKHIALELQPIAEGLNLTGDRELMEYACYNLLTNAIKYSPQRTRVTASARSVDGHIRIAVEDQGIGLDQKEVKQIFQKFYRTKKAEQSGESGTGIGLSIVQQIVEQHGGTIEVTSQPGVGSCFTLVMPAAVAMPESTSAQRN
jgi:signal transduction histidine kinase